MVKISLTTGLSPATARRPLTALDCLDAIINARKPALEMYSTRDRSTNTAPEPTQPSNRFWNSGLVSLLMRPTGPRTTTSPWRCSLISKDYLLGLLSTTPAPILDIFLPARKVGASDVQAPLSTQGRQR